MIADGVLAVVSLCCAAWLWQGGGIRQKHGALGLVLVAVAAAIGSARYGGMPLEALHVRASHVASAIGVPMIGGAYVAWTPKTLRNAAVTVMLMGLLLMENADYRLGAGALAMVLVLVPRQPIGAVGALLTIFAGLGIGTNGDWGGIARLDLFHYTLSVANICLAVGLSKLPSDALRA